MLAKDTTYVFESATYGGLYKHQVLGHQTETASHEARYLVRAWRIETTEVHGRYLVLEGPTVAWHSAEAVEGYYETRWK